MPKKSKHTEAGFSPNSTDSSCLRVAQMLRSPKVAIFVPTTTTMTDDCFTPCTCARGNNYIKASHTKSFSYARKIDYWLSFVETHRLPGVSPPHVVIIGSHYDLLNKRTPSEECTGFIAGLDSHIHSRLNQSKLCLDGFFAIDCR